MGRRNQALTPISAKHPRPYFSASSLAKPLRLSGTATVTSWPGSLAWPGQLSWLGSLVWPGSPAWLGSSA